jgi:hypothetical protein
MQRSVKSGPAGNHSNSKLIMGDRSPKDVKKQAAQKHVKDNAKEHDKEVVTEAQHHPVSGHPVTAEEIKEHAGEAP